MTYVDRGQQLAEQNAMAEREVRQLAAQQGRIDPQLLGELHAEVPPALRSQRTEALARMDNARREMQYAHQQPPMVGDDRERALQRIESEERQRRLRVAFDGAQQHLEEVERQITQAKRQAWQRRVSAQSAIVEGLRVEVPRRIEAAQRQALEVQATEQQKLARAEQELARLTRVAI